MMQVPIFRRLSLMVAAALFTFIMAAGFVYYSGASERTKKASQMNAFKVYQQKCLLCHDSIADPEKPGRTKDGWRLVVQIMHRNGLGLTQEETDLIVDLLYDLRKGLEKEAG
jgi:hypothetical protein